jgi:glycosyltransferase involved in cell wall biosynthesis
MLMEAVESVRAQTVGDWEHIVVDDGSASVPEIPGAQVLHVTHRGLGAARNAGLEAASGEVIALLDDDDVWLPHHLETVVAALEENAADVAYADCHEVGRRDGYAIDVRPFDGELLQVDNFICVPATVVRTESLRAVGGFPEGELEDWELWKRMHARGMSFVYVPEKTVLYRFHDDNLTYGGVDPERTAEARRLRDQAEAGSLGWEEYADRVTRLWR